MKKLLKQKVPISWKHLKLRILITPRKLIKLKEYRFWKDSLSSDFQGILPNNLPLFQRHNNRKFLRNLYCYHLGRRTQFKIKNNRAYIHLLFLFICILFKSHGVFCSREAWFLRAFFETYKSCSARRSKRCFYNQLSIQSPVLEN